jgi:hypothetical protein
LSGQKEQDSRIVAALQKLGAAYWGNKLEPLALAIWVMQPANGAIVRLRQWHERQIRKFTLFFSRQARRVASLFVLPSAPKRKGWFGQSIARYFSQLPAAPLVPMLSVSSVQRPKLLRQQSLGNNDTSLAVRWTNGELTLPSSMPSHLPLPSGGKDQVVTQPPKAQSSQKSSIVRAGGVAGLFRRKHERRRLVQYHIEHSQHDDINKWASCGFVVAASDCEMDHDGLHR